MLKSSGKHVTFFPTVTVQPVLSRKDYTQEEIKATWFSCEEVDAIKCSCAIQVDMLNMGVKLSEKKYSARGLEGFTASGCASKAKIRCHSFLVVVEEQCIQWMEYRKIVDHYTISRLYHQVTSSCELWARAVGLRDQKEAKACYSSQDVEEMRAQAKKSATQATLRKCLKRKRAATIESKEYDTELITVKYDAARAA
jgi:hypothetical protein